MALQPVILAGGSGTRLWPLSREHYPKQFLSVTGEHSMMQETLLRLDGLENLAPPIVVCNEEHRFLTAEHARQINKTPSDIILEPAGRNTAPALTLAALALTSGETADDDPVMLVLPADAVITDVEAFQHSVEVAGRLAEQGCLVTFGVVPTAPKTGYGYIKLGAPHSPEDQPDAANSAPHLLEAFEEKPDEARALEMLRSGQYLWNSGMFVLRASVWIENITRFREDIVEACRSAHGKSVRDGDFLRPDADLFNACPSESIDYAVMEKIAGNRATDATTPVVVPLDAGWSDVGAWSALLEVSDSDSSGNVVRGDVYASGMSNSLLIGQHRLLAAVGLDNVIVVETADAVLVAHHDVVEEVKDLVARLKELGRPEQENHLKVHRPWGTYEMLDSGSGFQVKRLTVNPGAALSLQMHYHRAEHWIVVHGTAKVTKGEEVFHLHENQSTDVPLGTHHRLENPESIPLEIIEVQSGSYLDEDDIVRFDDRYNRK
ncbi:MAG: mannose-1-phosphate guanylyltransferase/mannose-6-phosphate isomerase [SAR202 cluster bacterium]|nr:mannose-1-phosphate guanylyltransferase/mannose-6-phosphate isomerase [SAR202 cluster bacterium]